MSLKKPYSPIIQNAIGLCIQGDVRAAYEYLCVEPDKSCDEETFMQQLNRRFFVDDPKLQAETEDSWVQQVIVSYYRYFIAVLTKRASISDGEQMLLSQLRNLVTAQSLEEAEDKLKEQFIARGYYFLGGRTLPFWGPYIWKTQESQIFRVDIPSGTEHLAVHFMKDFLLVSWLEFATMGLASTGGWANQDGLFCVADRYPSLEDVEFVVSFLKHEAQHSADYRTFPGLSPKDLEYRAKLVELIFYPTKDKLDNFLLQADANVENAHAYAAYNIVSRLSNLLLDSDVELNFSRWGDVGIELLQQTALQLLNEHTNELLRVMGDAKDLG